jgi:hypothetical protein
MVEKDPRKTATSRNAEKAVSSGTGAAGSKHHPDAGTTLEIAQNRIADEPSPSMFAMASDNVISTSCRRKKLHSL